MSSISKALDILKNELQNEQDSSKFEKLVAALIGRLLNVPIAIASSGFQHGADAGPAGQHGRRFRLECKRYSDTTRLTPRELRGEIDEALERDEALEAWVLCTTRTVNEQIRQSLDQHGGKNGVPVLIIDWTEVGIPTIAALCASSPELVGEYVTTAARDAARAVRPESGNAIESLRRDLESWCLGFDSLRQDSHNKLFKIWNCPKESNAALGQNAAGGSKRKKVKRKAVHDGLDSWWRGSARNDAPAVVLGREGVGKTWATLHWLIDNIGDQPIVLIVPSSAAVSMVSDVSEANVIRLLARRLYELTGVRDSRHWERRLAHLLKRPLDEGPVLTVVFDGINQEPSVSWLNLLKVFQGVSFSGRTRVIVNTRKHHYENRLSMLKGLIASAPPIAVGSYDMTSGGEFDQMLAYEGLIRDDLHQDVLELTRKPRLFDLVVKFRDKLVEAGQITLHRLLWEYGRDTLGVRAGRSFSEDEWIDWLRGIANQHREGIQTYSLGTLGETVSRPDLTPSEVYARLSDIIDGRFATESETGGLSLTPTVVSHALGTALLSHLHPVTSRSFETLNVALKTWLDPISGFDQLAEILRAAVSILVEQGRATTPAAGVLLTAWLQDQNVTDSHRLEIADLATNFPNALLDAVEDSDCDVHESARHWAVYALGAIPKADVATLEVLIARTRRWMGKIYRDIDTRRKSKDEQRKWRTDQLRKLIGTELEGTIRVANIELELVERYPGLIKSTVPSILEGFPLRNAIPTFESAAAAKAAGDRSGCWDALKWLCLLNEADAEETAEGLRDLSEKVRCRIPEPGVHPDLPKRVAALLLCLTGCEKDDKAAAHLNPDIGHGFRYKRDYLSNPGQSLLPLERQHAHEVLKDRELPVQSRIKRIGELWLDPTFDPPDNFRVELSEIAANLDVEKLNRRMGPTIHDVRFEETVPALARFAPDLLADLMRRKLKGLETCPGESRYWSAISATNQFVLSGEAEAAAARALRRKGRESDKTNELFAASQLLLIEIRNLQGRNQVEAIIQADLPGLSCDFAKVLNPLTAADVDTLIKQYDSAPPKQQQALLTLLALQQVELTEFAWSWILRFTLHEDCDLMTPAFMILNQVDVRRFGRQLLEGCWSWSPNRHFYYNQTGSDSLIEASLSVSFEELAPRLAPWRLLEAARRRGVKPEEVRLAAAIFGTAVTADSLSNSDLGPDLTNVPARMRALETAAFRINEARRKGVDLFPVELDRRDIESILAHVPVYVEQWLNSWSGGTAQLEHRVFLASPVILTLCEVLLTDDPDRGANFWRGIFNATTAQVFRRIQVGDLLRLAFGVPDSPAVSDLRAEIVEQKYFRTDTALFEIALAASENDKTDWLNEVIEKDRTTPFAWRQMRATVLDGFRAHNSLPVAEAWPDGELKTTNSRLYRMSARSKWIEACARHWWKSYLDASDPAKAYAAWVLFLRSADSRCRVWMRADIDAISEKDDFFNLKMAHFHLNEDDLNRALKKRATELKKKFLYRKITEGIGPWT